ncbi:MAG: hypothetical protein HY735_32355 [Verrucomicrobia bacterium]|nr:hypothetical protein [Verrucomicrobiota bacterium]
MSTERTVDWELAKRCLAALQRNSEGFLGRALLIGGAACWFYRVQLQQANDPDFFLPPLAPQTEAKWLSKDIDFTGIFAGDALELLSRFVVRDAEGNSQIEVEGVRVGFAQVGLTIDPEEALREAHVGSFHHEGQLVEFLVIDPVSLCREKQALVQRRNQDQDLLHLALLREYLPWAIVIHAQQLLEARSGVPVEEQQQFANFALALRRKMPELLADARIAQRLKPWLEQDTLVRRFIKAQLQLA